MNNEEFIRVNMSTLYVILKTLKAGDRINLMKTTKNRFIIIPTEFDPTLANDILTAEDLDETIH